MQILRLLEGEGYEGVWVDTYRNKHRRGYWGEPPVAALPEYPAKNLKRILDHRRAGRSGTWDVFAWRDDSVFLTPRRGVEVWGLEPFLRVRITYDRKRWYIRSSDDEPLFSFDLPTELFEMYAEDFALNREQASLLKDEFLNELQLIVTNNDAIRVITLRLDPEWFDRVRADARGRR